MGIIPADISGPPTPFGGNPPVLTNNQELPYGDLTWENFERLCLRLAKSEAKVEECRRYGVQGDEQEGIDIYALKGDSIKFTVYQSKRVRYFPPSKIKSAVSLFLRGTWANESEAFVLCSMDSMSTRAKTDEILKQRKKLLAKSIQFRIWDSNELDSRLKSNPQIVYDFFGEPWLKGFCGLAAFDKVAKVSKAQKKAFPPPAEYIPRRVFQTGAEELQGRSIETGKPLREVLNEHSKIVLLGGAGVGKSIEMEKLLSDLSSPEEILFPIQINMDLHTGKELKDYVLEGTGSLNGSLLCLDGFDEVQSGTFDTVRRKIIAFATEFPDNKIIVTCRSNFYTTIGEDPNLNTLTGFTSFQFASLTHVDVDNYLEAKLSGNKVPFLQEINERHLGDLLFAPYYLVRLTRRYLTNGQVPNSKAEFFEDVINEGVKKDAARYFPDQRIHKEKEMSWLLERLAFLLEYQGRNTCPQADLIKIFNESELKVVKCTGSLLHASEDSLTWQFSHNNVQEYLAARVTSRLQLSQVKSLVAFPTKFRKVKPSWVNTLSLLITILAESNNLRQQLLSWLIESAPELVVRVEPDRLDEDTRHQVFENIARYYKREGRIINRNKFNLRELMRFSMSAKTIDFLLAEIRVSEPIISRKSALELVSHCAGSTLTTNQKEKAKALIEQNLFTQPSEVIYLAVKAYIKLFKLSNTAYDKLLNTFKAEKDTWIRYVLFHSVHSQGQQDRHIDFVLAEISKLMADEFGNTERLSNEYSELKECLEKVESLAAFEKVLDFIADDIGRVFYSIHFGEIVETTLDRVSVLYPDNSSLFEKVIEIYTSEEFHLDANKSEVLLKYFRSTKQVGKAFHAVYSGIKNPPDYHSLHTLSLLIDDDSAKFLVNEFQNGKLNRHFVEQLQYYMQTGSTTLLQFNAGINKTEVIPLPAARNIDNALVDRIKRTKEILFAKDRFKAALEQVFIDQRKNELSYDEVWEVRHDYDRYLPVIHDTIRLFERSQTVNRENLLAVVDSKWADFSIVKIVEFLKEFPTAELNQAELNIVNAWCDQAVGKVDFKTALSSPTADRTTANQVAIKLSFLIRKLKMSGYPKAVYLDMLSFQKWDDNEVEIFNFVESLVDKQSITERVLLNLASGITFHAVLTSHLDYCTRLSLKQAAPSLIKYLTDNEHQKYEVLDCYIAIGGDIGSLDAILPSVTGDFRFYFYQTLIRKESQLATKYLQGVLKSERDEETKLRIAELLIEVQVGSALRYYISYIKRTKSVPGDSSPSNPLNKLRDLRLICYAFQLYELSFDKTIRQDGFNRLSDIAAGTLQGICLYESNFPKAKFIFKVYKFALRVLNFTRLRRVHSDIIPNLAFYFENFEEQFYVNKGSNVNLNDALKILPMLQREN